MANLIALLFVWFEGRTFLLYVGIAVLVIVTIGIIKAVVNHRKEKQEQARIAAEKEEARKRLQKEKEAEKRRHEEAQRYYRQKLERRRQAIENNPGSEKYVLPEQQTETSVHLMTITEFDRADTFVAFDLETTGLDTADDAIVEIGAVKVVNGQLTDRFQQLVHPERKMPAAATAVNNITDGMLYGQPLIDEVLPAFLNFVGDAPLAAQNAKFDARFLSQACMRNSFRMPANCFDTMSLARYWPDAPDKKLTTLAAAAGIDNPEAHRALGDAETVARLILATGEKRHKK